MAAPQLASVIKTDSMVEILMMGLTGAGKSATGNTILGRKSFRSQGGFYSVTKDYHVSFSQVGKRMVKVVDIPGFRDTCESDQLGLVIDSVTRSLIQVRKGFDAVLLVVPYISRLSREDYEYFAKIVTYFDKEAFRNYGILVITFGNHFRNDFGDVNINDWIRQQSRGYLYLSEVCSNRVILFENYHQPSESVSKPQVVELLKMIDSMKHTEKYIPKICKLEGEELEKFTASKDEIIAYEMINHELTVLDYLLRKEQTEENKNLVDRQVVLIRDLMKHHDICVSNYPIIEKWSEMTTDDAKKSEAIHMMQLEFEKKISQTSYWVKIKEAIVKAFRSTFVGAKGSTCSIV